MHIDLGQSLVFLPVPLFQKRDHFVVAHFGSWQLPPRPDALSALALSACHRRYADQQLCQQRFDWAPVRGHDLVPRIIALSSVRRSN